MGDCWKTLGIEPTSDTVAIRNAYRELVKKYHPDTVSTAEQKRQYTIFCALINEAYEEALRWAKSDSGAGPAADEEAAPYSDLDSSSGLLWKTVGALNTPFVKRLVVGSLLIALTGFAVFPVLAASLTRSLSYAVRLSVATVAGVSVVLFVLLFIAFYGVAIGGILDLLLVLLVPRKLITKLGLEKYEDNALWVLIVAANFGLFFGTNLIAIPNNNSEQMFWLYDSVFRALAAATVPLILASLWLRRIIRHRRLRDHAGQV
jgi:hypothetical protein